MTIDWHYKVKCKQYWGNRCPVPKCIHLNDVTWPIRNWGCYPLLFYPAGPAKPKHPRIIIARLLKLPPVRKCTRHFPQLFNIKLSRPPFKQKWWNLAYDLMIAIYHGGIFFPFVSSAAPFSPVFSLPTALFQTIVPFGEPNRSTDFVLKCKVVSIILQPFRFVIKKTHKFISFLQLLFHHYF